MEGRPLEDPELVERAKRGDTDAYGVLVRRYQELAVRVGQLITEDPAEAEDAAQEAFVKAFYALGRLRPGASFRPWLLRIVANEARNRRKAARRRADLLARASGDRPSGGAAPSPEAATLANEQRRALLRALGDLREEDRLAIAYRYFFDLSEAEMAEALGCARGTVKSRLSRALGRLRRGLRGRALVAWPVSIPGGRSGPMAEDLAELGDPELEQALVDLAADMPYRPTRDLADVVLRRIPAGEPPEQPSSGTPPPVQAPLGLAVLALFLAAGLLALSPGVRAALTDRLGLRAGTPAEQMAAGEKVVVYGGDLSEAERQELAAAFGIEGPATTDTVTREELAAALRAADLPVAPTDEAISSAALMCSKDGEGLRVRTQHITRIPAAAYAGALLTAGVADGSVIIAAPSAKPVTGETALAGVLKAVPRCQGGQQLEPARVRLAYEQLRATAALARDPADLSKASVVMLTAAQAVVTGRAKDEASMGAALDVAAAGAGVAMDPAERSELVSLLRKLGGLDYGPYAGGYQIQQIAPDELQLVPASAGGRGNRVGAR